MPAMVPEKVEKLVVSNLFADAEAMNWPHMNLSQRSKQYNAWVSDPRIGEVLKRFMAGEEARVWIKDGPMKEFARALSGQGKYASLIVHRAPSAATVVKLALGEGWTINPDSQNIKPLRVRAYNDEEEVMFAWGPAKDFKHLLWAALNSIGKHDNLSWILCLTAPFVNPTPSDLRTHNELIAEHCGVRIIHLSVS